MDKPTWNKLKSIFEEASAKPLDEQQAFVFHALGRDSPNAKQVLDMLRAAEQKPSDLDQLVVGELTSLVSERFELTKGSEIGDYVVERLIGKGGMGNVYLANRNDNNFAQKVAIKIINSHSISTDTIERFQTERQILAGLQHNNIARLFDGGTTPNGLPYLVMEFVDGETIIDYCQSRKLDLNSRLLLFKKVCAAVNFAHQNLVVHRDIKPSNVMVDNEGNVKLLDFGIAKLLKDDVNNDITQQAERYVTPANAPPEQINGQPITTRTDVYELGALLYHLISGVPLFNIESRIRSLLEKAILEETPTKPSEVLTSRQSDSKNSDQFDRGISTNEVKGDLDVITLNALQKEPERRYQSVQEFSDDIDRYIHHYPIKAKADHWLYRINKFIRRNRTLSLVSGVFTVALGLFIATVIYQSLEIQKQKQVAQLEAKTANEVVDFLVGIFEKADPNEHDGNVPNAIELIDIATESIGNKALDDRIRMKLLQVLGLSYQKSGEYDKAKPLIDKAVAIGEIQYQKTPEKMAMLLYYLGDLEYERGHYEKAEAILNKSLKAFNQLLAKADEDYSTIEYQSTYTLTGLGAVLGDQGRFDEAGVFDQKALAITLKYYGENSSEAGEIYNSIGHVLRNQGKFDEAKRILQKGVKSFRNAKGDNQLWLAHSLNQLSRTMSFLKEYDAALPIAEEGYQIRQKVHAKAHPETAASLGNLSNIYTKLGRYDDAIAVRKQSLAMLVEVFGDSHDYVAATYNSLGGIQLEKGDLPSAKQSFEKSIRLMKKLMSSDGIRMAFPLTQLGRVTLLENQVEQSLVYLKQAYRIREKGLPKDHWRIGVTGWYLAQALEKNNHLDEAVKHYREAARILELTYGKDDDRVKQITQKLKTKQITNQIENN